MTGAPRESSFPPIMTKVPDVSDAAAKFRADAERARRAGDNLNPRDRDSLHRYAAELEGKAASLEAPEATAPTVEEVAAQPVEVAPEAPAEVPAPLPLDDVTKSG